MDDLAPVLAPALSRFVRSPGANLNWVDRLLRQLESELPDTFDRFRRVSGLSLKIASLAGLTPQESAALVPAALFVTLAHVRPGGGTAFHAWLRCLREERWAQEALHAARLVMAPGREEAGDSRAAVTLAAAVVIDDEAVVRSANALRALRELQAQAQTPEANRIAALLWTERGQSICDLHARHGSRTYTVDAATLKESLRALRGERRQVPPRQQTPSRAAAAGPEQRKQPAASVPTPTAATSEAFERRKRAVAGAHSLREAFGLPAAGRAAQDERATPGPEPVAVDHPSAPAPGPAQRTREDAPKEGRPETGRTEAPGPAAGSTQGPAEPLERATSARGTPEPVPTPDEAYEEAPMNAPAHLAQSPAEIDGRLTDALEELRTRLADIERLASEGQKLLTALVPTIEGFAAMVAEFESALSRWKGRSEAA